MHASRYTSERNLLWLKEEMQECFKSRGHHSNPDVRRDIHRPATGSYQLYACTAVAEEG